MNPMATTSPPRATALLVLLLLFTASLSHSASYTQLRNLLSLSHSLTLRVANLRASRGDHSGAARARLVAARLEEALGLGFWRMAWSVGWEYVRSYAWRDIGYQDLQGAAAEVNELARWLSELSRAESDVERAAWLGRNYPSLLRVFKSLLGRLLQLFRRSGPLREMVKMVQKEVVEGELVKDCIEIGSKDLNELFQILSDIISPSSSPASSRSYEDGNFRDL